VPDSHQGLRPEERNAAPLRLGRTDEGPANRPTVLDVPFRHGLFRIQRPRGFLEDRRAPRTGLEDDILASERRRELATLEAEIVAETEDTATLMLKTANEDPEEVEMVRVEGRWIPADLAQQWPEMMANARQHLDEMTPETMSAMKTQAMMGLGMAEGLIEQIATIESAEQFDAAVGPLLQGLMGSFDFGDSDDSGDSGDSDDSGDDEEYEEPEEE